MNVFGDTPNYHVKSTEADRDHVRCHREIMVTSRLVWL